MLDAQEGYDEIDHLRRFHTKLGWFQRLFFSSELYRQLKTPSITKFDLFKTANTRQFRLFLWAFNLISSTSNQFNFFDMPRVQSWMTLQNKELLTDQDAQANFNAVLINQSPKALFRALLTLNQVNLLAQDNFNKLALRKETGLITDILLTLTQTGLLSTVETQTNFNHIVSHPDLKSIAEILFTLNKTVLFNVPDGQTNFNTVLTHQIPMALARIISTLHQVGLLNTPEAQTNFNKVITHQHLWRMADVLFTLKKSGFLNESNAQDIFNYLETHPNLALVANALLIANRAGLLKASDAQGNFDAIVTHKKPVDMANALWTLNREGLLTKANRDALIAHLKPAILADALRTLSKACDSISTPDTPANRNAVVSHESPDLIIGSFTFWRAYLSTSPTATRLNRSLSPKIMEHNGGGMKSTANTDVDKKIINLDISQTPLKCALSYAYELKNLHNAEKYNALNLHAKKRRINKSKYIKQTLQLEAEAVFFKCQIIREMGSEESDLLCKKEYLDLYDSNPASIAIHKIALHIEEHGIVRREYAVKKYYGDCYDFYAKKKQWPDCYDEQRSKTTLIIAPAIPIR